MKKMLKKYMKIRFKTLSRLIPASLASKHFSFSESDKDSLHSMSAYVYKNIAAAHKIMFSEIKRSNQAFSIKRMKKRRNLLRFVRQKIEFLE